MVQANGYDRLHQTRDVDHALWVFGITIFDDDTTDPTIMMRILKEVNIDLDSLDQTLEGVQLIKRLVSERIPLKPLKDMIMIGIQQNPPLYNTLLERAKEQKQQHTLTTLQKEQSTYSLDFIVILETLTYLMVNDKALEYNIINMILKQRRSLNTGSTFWNLMSKLIETKGDLFTAIKTISIDPLIFETILFRQYPPHSSNEDLDNFIKQNHLTGLNAGILKRSTARHQTGEKNHGVLYGNILEAVTKEETLIRNKYCFLPFLSKKIIEKSSDNIKAGLALLSYLDRYQDVSTFSFKQGIFNYDSIQQLHTLKADSSFWKDVHTHFNNNNLIKSSAIYSKEFINVYEAWNIAFVCRNFPTRDYLFLPKLLIPSTLCCIPEYYFAPRLLSLWLTINFISALRMKKLIIEQSSSNRETLIAIFGKHNFLYAKEVLLKNEVDLDKLYEEQVHQPLALTNYLKAIRLLMS